MTSPECAIALERLYQFLDHELDDADADAIRAHQAELLSRVEAKAHIVENLIITIALG